MVFSGIMFANSPLFQNIFGREPENTIFAVFMLRTSQTHIPGESIAMSQPSFLDRQIGHQSASVRGSVSGASPICVHAVFFRPAHPGTNQPCAGTAICPD